MNFKLAINGGKNIRTKEWPVKNINNKKRIMERLESIINSNNLSGYRGSFGQHFWGGKFVRSLERYFENYIDERSILKGAKVLAVNSCTSALQIACGAIGIDQFSEVIVTPWSMTCSATAPLIYSGIPVFADIEKDYFCLSPEDVEKKITRNTKAIIAVDLFGNPYNVDEINRIAKKYDLYVIEDCAQALGASFDGNMTGILGDIGCFSFTQGKHFTCGEGGFIVTRDEDLYTRCALIRNHAESVINSMPENTQKNFYYMNNQAGFNMRMTELQAAVLLSQFESNGIDSEVQNRNFIVNELTRKIYLPGINWKKNRENCKHSYYVLPFIFDEGVVGISRNRFIEAVKAELRLESTNMGITKRIDPLIWEGYIKPIYKMPIFEKQSRYRDFELPNVVELQNEKFCFTTFQGLPLDNSDISDIVSAFCKVYENIGELK